MHPPRAEGAQSITAQLGPTNTGKTHRAVERMLQHGSGMIGLPLRLLAREVYDRVSARVGEGAVALVTGEEKRVPPRPRYWVCTVEAMPIEREVDFVAVDEIQLCGHPERGHVFTDRLLHGRGRRETWFLGADTIRPILEGLVPTAVIDRRPRLSRLYGAGALPLRSLPPRTAVVAFSAGAVYRLAELLRVRRGGAAVVLGALSPRARNAQVALYQAGEVDYLVASDAIGMGLNMDVDCVAFAELCKFDGRQTRELQDAELAQIAGRAGRYHNDGRFATLAPLPPLPAAVSHAIEDHRFPAQRRIFWRSRDLDTSSLDALLASLRQRPFAACLELQDSAEDSRALARLAQDSEVLVRARNADSVALLWEVCQIPDYRQLQLDDHFQLLRAVFLQLQGARPRLADDWIRHHVDRLDDAQGDIDTLLARMAFIRTWTYITHHPQWVDDARAWQERARAIEDRLSDALHERLVARFVDPTSRRTRARGRRDGSLGQQLRAVVPSDTRAQDADANTAIPRWIDGLVEAGHERFRLDDAGRILDGDRALARLAAGVDRLRPEITLLVNDLGAGQRLRLHRRLVAWTRDWVAQLLAPLRDERLASLGPAVRGLVYQLEQGLGTVLVASAREQVRELDPRDRSVLGRAGVRVGRNVVFSSKLLQPAALRERTLLCQAEIGRRIEQPRADAASSVPSSDVSDATYVAMGFPVIGSRAIRSDLVEIVASRLVSGASPAEIARRLGCTPDEVEPIRRALAPSRRRSRR
ncbi:MAG: helicase-related protein [Polyangia bacterium]|jgi:ATP-dependent RNA helicase SUPV3L1/SUV3